MKKIFRYGLKTAAILILAAFSILIAGFLAVRLGWTNVAGEEDNNSDAYNLITDIEPIVDKISSVLPENISVFGPNEHQNWCRLGAAAAASPQDAKGIYEAYSTTKSNELLERMLLALKLRQGSDSALATALDNCDNDNRDWDGNRLESLVKDASGPSAYSWQNSEYWQIIKEAILKDKADIEEASLKAGIQPRLLVSVAIVEQLRLYYTQREFYEKFFKPLKILANANKMAWGVMSIKEKMAIETEEHLRDTESPFYLGQDKEALLDFPAGSDVAKTRYDRLTNEKDHYYSYLYGALIIKQFQVQWQKAGYDLQYRPEIIATLFNIGFQNSQPKAEPAVGGSTLEIDGEKYYFGSLAYEFYYSGELADEFIFE